MWEASSPSGGRNRRDNLHSAPFGTGGSQRRSGCLAAFASFSRETLVRVGAAFTRPGSSLASRAINHVRTYHAISSMVEQTVDCYQDLLVRRRTFTLNSGKPVSASGRTTPSSDSTP